MKEGLIALLFTLFSVWLMEGEGTLIHMSAPPYVIDSAQNLDVVIVGSDGTVNQQKVYYTPYAKGFEINTSWGGPNASLWFPAWGTGLIWVDGHWVDESGKFWEGKTNGLIAIPNWNSYWVGYWQKYWDDSRGLWQRGSRYRDDNRKKYFSRNRNANKPLENAEIKKFNPEKPLSPSEDPHKFHDPSLGHGV